jgi:hypothetical protein
MDFLRDPVNKKVLYAFSISNVAESIFEPDKAVYVTLGESIKYIYSDHPMSDCTDEEADTWIEVHVLHALEHGNTTVQVRTVDADVVIILAGAFYELIHIQQLTDIWASITDSTALMQSVSEQ